MSESRLRGPGEVAEDQAGPALARTYSRLREILGVEFVPTIYRMLAVHEDYLAAATDSIGELVQGRAGKDFAIQAREMAGLAARSFPGAPIATGDDAVAVDALLDRYNTANPRSLLVARALLPDGPTDPGEVMAPREARPEEFDDTRAVLEDVEVAHGEFVKPGMWRELEEYPAVLTKSWLAVSPLGDLPAFQEVRSSLLAAASVAAAGVKPPDPDELGLDDAEVASIETILTWFTRGISAMVVEIEYLRKLINR